MRALDFQELVETVPDIVTVLDAAGRYVYSNPAREQLTGTPSSALIGQSLETVLHPDELARWRATIAEVLQTGRTRVIERTLTSASGPRQLASLVSRLSSDRVCVIARDITDAAPTRLLGIAARAMPTGLAIAEAPSGRILFVNDESERMFGASGAPAEAFDLQHRRIADEQWPLARALRGETTVEEWLEISRPDGARRTISINASPVRDVDGQLVAAVATYHDITDARRTHEAASYLAEAGALLERFDPETSLQAIVDLAVPVLADWCFIHLATDGHPKIVAIANADPDKAAAARARNLGSRPLSSDTAVARVLAGGPREIVQVDTAVLERAAHDPAHLARLRAQGYASAVVAPLTGRDGVLGAVTFTMAESGRRYEDADLDMLAELARRTGIALDNARLFAAEQRARKHAEEARDRTRRLQTLTAALSPVIEKHEVVATMVRAGRDALGADGGFAWLLRGPDTLEVAAFEDSAGRSTLAGFSAISMSQHLPVCDAVRAGRLAVFESVAAMTAAYPDAVPPSESPSRAWTVVPFVVGGQGVGAVSFTFDQERTFSEEDRELLVAMMGQASLALERCMLLEAERRARADAEDARKRERQLHVLAGRLSLALTPAQVAEITCQDVMLTLRGISVVAAIRDDDAIRILGTAGVEDDAARAKLTRIPLDAVVPTAEAVRTSELVWCASTAELERRYPHLRELWHELGIGAWGAVPFTFEGRTIGSLGFACADERELEAVEREFLHAVGQLAAQALERARLFEALQRREEQLRVALLAARAATWHLDLATMQTTRDPSYLALLGLDEKHGKGDFAGVHPDDRDAARSLFERTLREGVPFEPESRVQRGDGTFMWIRSHGRLTYGADGAPTALAGVVVDITEAKHASLRAEEERRINDLLHRLGTSFAGELDHDRLVQLITEQVGELVGATYRAFVAEGADRLPGPDQLRSTLTIPIVARSGERYGVLRFGHPDEGQFTPDHERLVISIAGQAAVALENARLYRAVREHREQLEHAIERARIADRRKDEFLAMLGHELRNPLAPIATALELMELKGATVDQREREVIRRQVAHMSRLVDDLLDVSRITRGKIELEKTVTELSDVLANAVEMASPLLEKRAQRLALEVARTGLPVEADPTRLAQVFQNLLTNAAKYSEERTQITLRARVEGAHVVIEVHDEGIGIAPELIPRLFELFVQGERALDRSQGGLGLGLTLARSLIELHGGTIDATSAGEGRGSTFRVTLPKASTAASNEPVSGRRLAISTAAVRVMIVDDNIDAAETLHEVLSTLGHDTAVAHDALAALQLASTFHPHVAVLDIGLPVMDGYELARKLREQVGDAALRLIAVTGYGQEDDRTRAREAGFDHHLVKPIGLDALIPLIQAKS